jgi:hypothetical protein
MESFRESCHWGGDATLFVFQTSATRRKLLLHPTIWLVIWSVTAFLKRVFETCAILECQSKDLALPSCGSQLYWMCVSRAEMCGFCSSNVVPMLQIKKGEMPRHAKDMFVRIWNDTCYLHIFFLFVVYFRVIRLIYHSYLFSSIKSRQESICENLELHLDNNGPWRMLGKPSDIYNKVILILE